MKILALEQDVPGVTSEQFQPHLKAEAAKVWELNQAGVIRETYFRQDRASAILVLECADPAQADKIASWLGSASASDDCGETDDQRQPPGALSRRGGEC